MLALRIIIVLYCCAIGSASLAAGFDCSKSMSTVEKMICADEALSTLDSQLQEAYQLALGDASFPKKADIKRSQEQWIANVRNQCGNRSCLQAAYSSRLDILASIKVPTVSAHYVTDDVDTKRVIAEFQKQLNQEGFPGDLRECKRVIRLDGIGPSNEQMVSAGKDMSYGAICSFNDRLVMMCDDTMIGKMTLKLTGFTVNGPALAEFSQMNCPAGG